MCEPIRPIQKSKTFASQCLNLPEFIDFFFQIQKHHHFSYPNARKENESNESKLKDLKYELD